MSATSHSHMNSLVGKCRVFLIRWPCSTIPSYLIFLATRIRSNICCPKLDDDIHQCSLGFTTISGYHLTTNATVTQQSTPMSVKKTHSLWHAWNVTSLSLSLRPESECLSTHSVGSACSTSEQSLHFTRMHTVWKHELNDLLQVVLDLLYTQGLPAYVTRNKVVFAFITSGYLSLRKFKCYSKASQVCLSDILICHSLKIAEGFQLVLFG